MILIPTSYNFFFGSPSLKNSKVKRVWPRAMGDRPGSPSRVRMSEDKVRRKDLCWSVRVVYVLEKLPDVSGPGLGEAGRYKKKRMRDLLEAITFLKTHILRGAGVIGGYHARRVAPLMSRVLPLYAMTLGA